ncbi:MAG: hypothetical protein ACYC6L_14345 [Anaerolineae bacterium]
MPRTWPERTTAAVTILALIGLGLAFLPGLGPKSSLWLVFGCTIVLGAVFIYIYLQESRFWWLPTLAALIFCLAITLIFAPWLPGQKLAVAAGIVLAGAGLTSILIRDQAHTPEFLLAFGGAVLFAAVAFVLAGLGYRVWFFTLLAFGLGFGLALTALYLPVWPLRIAAALICLAGVLISPQAAAAVRLLLPLVLVYAGLAVVRYARRQPG